MLLTAKEVALRLRLDPETVRRHIRAGRLPAIKVAGGGWRVEEEALGRVLQDNDQTLRARLISNHVAAAREKILRLRRQA